VAIILKPENLAWFVFFIRGEKVMLDSDLATFYGVEARALNQAVARNRKRFPADFMFQLTPGEYESLRSQTVISKKGGSTDDLSQSVMSAIRRQDERLRSQIVTQRVAGANTAPALATGTVVHDLVVPPPKGNLFFLVALRKSFG
jgi:ORF6N domain